MLVGKKKEAVTMPNDAHVKKIKLDDAHEAAAWTPSSWRQHPIKQNVEYADQDKLQRVLEKVAYLPPLVHPGEVEALKAQLAEAAEGKRFILQGGDCAELFNYCNQEQLENKVKILLQMSLILAYGARMPIVRIARIAGQYGKPRSNPTEVVEGREVLSYRGDNVNGIGLEEREPCPDRLLQAYFHSAATLNYIRAMLNGGFADLRHPEHWEMTHVKNHHTRSLFEAYADKVVDALHFNEQILGPSTDAVKSVQLYSSHEGLMLPYEEALTMHVGGKHYNGGAHFLWIGDRTRSIDGAHVEYFRGIANPIGVKVGPSMQPDELVQLIKKLDPRNEPGRLTIISRYGADKIEQYLPAHIRAVQESGWQVCWQCDPMHGNTVSTADGLKTRDFDRVLTELRHAFRIHREMGRQLNGVHFELTGDNVTECLGGATKLEEKDLRHNYQTHCDPRLNYSQSIDMAFLIAEYFKSQREGAMPMKL